MNQLEENCCSYLGKSEYSWFKAPSWNNSKYSVVSFIRMLLMTFV